MPCSDSLFHLMVRDWRPSPEVARLLTNEKPPRGPQCVTAPRFVRPTRCPAAAYIFGTKELKRTP